MSASFSNRWTLVFATLALLTSISFGSSVSAPGFGRLLVLGTSLVVFFWLAASPLPDAVRMAVATALAIGPTVLQIFEASWWNVSLHNLLKALFGAHGLLYGAPLLWAGFLGLIGLRRENPRLVRLALAAIVPGILSLLISSGPLDVPGRTLTWAPFLLPGLVYCLDRTRAFATRRPEGVLAGAGVLMVVWNLLFMEQYRRRLLPSDDTVSFAQVTSNSAGILSRTIGTPMAWPANWIFAWRFDATPDRWDAIADRRLFTDTKALTSTVEIGDDPSVFAPDTPLLLEGFGDRRTCGQGWCRDLLGAGRILLPLEDEPTDLLVRLRARGEGALNLSVNGASTSAEMTDSLSDVLLRVPAQKVRPGVNVISLSVAGGTRATLDRLTLERGPAISSAR